METIVDEKKIIIASEEVGLNKLMGDRSHIWLDPSNMDRIGERIKKALRLLMGGKTKKNTKRIINNYLESLRN